MADENSTCTSKACTNCARTKPLGEFAKDGGRIRNQCKQCRAAALRRRRRAEPADKKAKRAAYCKAYAMANSGAISENKRRYYTQNRERISQESRDRYASDLEFQSAIKERSTAWRRANPKRKAQANKEWLAANRERGNEAFRRSKAKRRKNPTHRLYSSISTQMRLAISDRKGGRRWESIVGYSLADLVAHIEKQFLPGMSWDTYGPAWHIDHIVPQVSFELPGADDETVRACWALTNLRPLWALPNLSKGARRTHLI